MGGDPMLLTVTEIKNKLGKVLSSIGNQP